MDKMKIEIWSDIACPYCYIGKRRLENALKQFAHADEIDIVWHSYELNPNLPKKPLGESIYSFIARQHGVSEDIQRKSLQEIVNSAKEIGLDYNFDKLIVTNTSDALRLIKLANKYNLADQAEEILFKAYFTDGENISDKATLVRLGKEIGINEDEIIKMIDSDIFISDIANDIKYSENQLDLQYIPFYFINNKDIIQGSLTTEKYLEALNKSYDNWKQNGVSQDRGESITGKACSIDGVCDI